MKKNPSTTKRAATYWPSPSVFVQVLMFRMLFTLTFLCAFAKGVWAESDYLQSEWVDNTTEGLDSASYAYGDVIIRSILVSKDSLFPDFERNKENLSEVIRGFEDDLAYVKYSQDSIKNISFTLGAMQGVFFSDGLQSQKDSIPYDCLLAGLTKVVNHDLSLPQDTIKVSEFMNSLPEDMNPMCLPDEDKCRFFTGYGIMKGLQPGLQGYILEATGKSEDEAPANQEAYASGFAMMVKCMSIEAKPASEQSPYDYGVLVGISLKMLPLPFHFSETDFLDGCRAAAGLTERKMTVEESDHMMSTVFPDEEKPTIIQESNPD